MLRRAVETARATAPRVYQPPRGIGAHQALARRDATCRRVRACLIDAWWHRLVGVDRPAPGVVARRVIRAVNAFRVPVLQGGVG